MASTLKAKSLCKLNKEMISKHFDEIAAVTKNSQYVCSKCARSSDGKKWLCKPVSI